MMPQVNRHEAQKTWDDLHSTNQQINTSKLI